MAIDTEGAAVALSHSSTTASTAASASALTSASALAPSAPEAEFAVTCAAAGTAVHSRITPNNNPLRILDTPCEGFLAICIVTLWRHPWGTDRERTASGRRADGERTGSGLEITVGKPVIPGRRRPTSHRVDCGIC